MGGEKSMCGTGASLNDKIDLAPWGYAPGDQLVTCTDCAKSEPLDSLHFLHRHAFRCAKHALEARRSDIQARQACLGSFPARVITYPAPEPVKPVDHWLRRAFIGAILLGSVTVGLVILH